MLFIWQTKYVNCALQLCFQFVCVRISNMRAERKETRTVYPWLQTCSRQSATRLCYFRKYWCMNTNVTTYNLTNWINKPSYPQWLYVVVACSTLQVFSSKDIAKLAHQPQAVNISPNKLVHGKDKVGSAIGKYLLKTQL